MYSVDQETFEKLVNEGIKRIPEEFQDEFDNLSFVIEDFPTPYQRQKLRLRNDFSLFGLYEGVPLSKRGSGYSGALPDKISIFKIPIETAARDEEHLRRIVINTVWHEVAHHFGMDEDEVRAAEKARGHFYG